VRPLALFALCLFTAAPAARSQTNEQTVFFFCPEVSVNNHAALKDEFDAYFFTHGGFKFQPLSHLGQCETAVTGRTDSLLLVSSAQYLELPNRERLRAALVGVQDGNTHQRQALYVQSELTDVYALEGATIATAGSSDHTVKWLINILGSQHADLIKSFNLLKVPKHVDALLAVSFGMAQAAVAADGVAQHLAEVSPKQMSLVRPLAFGEPSLLPLVVVPTEARGDFRMFVQLLEDMSSDKQGRRCLKMLGLDDLQPLDAAGLEDMAP
jgi:hypothetical protein